MQYPIRALRVTSDRTGSHTDGEVEIQATRGNANILAMVARRANRLVQLARDFSIRSMATDDYAGGALVLRRSPLHVFHVRSVELDVAIGRAPRISLVGPEAARLILNQDGALDLKALAQAPTTPVDASVGEVTCPSCDFTSIRAALKAPHSLGCPECGHPAHLLLAEPAAAEVA